MPRSSSASADANVRPRVQGKFISVGDEKLYIRGVTYGTFRLCEDGSECYDRETVERDFACMAASGVNAVRTYTVPPRWLLDTARQHDLRIMVGLAWEQHVAFLDDKRLSRLICERVRHGVRQCAGHPAVLCYTIGNEIPSSIVRWHGHARVEGFLKQLYQIAKAEDPDGLITYVNYPSTEYLQLPFVDFVCFNVYLESRKLLEAYLARLHNIADDRPLVLAEIGFDSQRNGKDLQARTLDWQIRTAFASGCAGAFVFAWTDEWYRGGFEIEDWDFGLTNRQRKAKPALHNVQKAFAEVPFPVSSAWPRISVVVCTYNGEATIRDCLNGLLNLRYPDFEAIVIDDGSTDATAQIAGEYPVRLISTENQGLSRARNTGMDAATGEIIAYIDDDARPDPHWLYYLAWTFVNTTHAGVGGPNIAPPGDGFIAECVANAPGGPVHVLLNDEEAEHIPGCNMAFRRQALQEINGFDPQYRAAGDDVDLCWQLQQRGWTLGFSPAAVVWHHRRNSVRTYWRQQVGYGKAEALLEAKWPEKYNAVGHHAWAGRLYGRGLTEALGSRAGRIYQGTWGSGLFQSIYQPAPGLITSLPLMPEWYLIIVLLAALSSIGVLWTPLLLALPLLVLAVAVLFAQAGLSAGKASFANRTAARSVWLKLWALTVLLHLMQPLARLRGRLAWGLTPWRNRGLGGLSMPWSSGSTVWSEHWQSADEKLCCIEKALSRFGACVVRGGNFDAWDLEVRGGMFGSARTLMAIEEHGSGKQLARFRLWPKPSAAGLAVVLLFTGLSVAAVLDEAWSAAAVLGLSPLLGALRTFYECAGAMSTVRRALLLLRREEEEKEVLQSTSPEPLVSQPSAEIVPPEVVAAAAAARLTAAVPPNAVSSVGSSLFRNQVVAVVEASEGATELRYDLAERH